MTDTSRLIQATELIENYLTDGYRIVPVWGKATRAVFGKKLISRPPDTTAKAPCGTSWNDSEKRPQATASELAEHVVIYDGAIGLQMADNMISLDVDKGAESIELFTKLAVEKGLPYDLSDNGIHILGTIPGDFAGKQVKLFGYDITLRTASSKSQIIVAPSNIAGKVREWGIYKPKNELPDLSTVFPELMNLSKDKPVIPTPVPGAPKEPKEPKKRRKISSCELLNVLLSSPEKMREHWKNGAGNYFNDLMQVLPMANGVENIELLQSRIETILTPVRADVHKEHAAYYAGKEPNCVGLKSVCTSMGIACDVCGVCRSRIPQIPGLIIGRGQDNRPVISKVLNNAVLLIEHDYPNMLKRDGVKERNLFGDRLLTDGDRLEIFAKIDADYRVFDKTMVNDAIDLILSRNTFDPLVQLISKVKHDGTNRLDNILRDLCGCVDDAYTRALSRYIGVAMISRAINPGAKADIVPILYSPVQGSGKSTFCEKLAYCVEDYYTQIGSMSDFGSQKTIERTSGAWIVEFAEMTAMQKTASEEELKAFVTTRFDKYRPAYGREVKEIGRRCVFIGTTNVDTILKDATGSRRWWLIRVSDDCPHKYMTTEQVNEYLLQYYAEAKLAVEAGEVPDIRSDEVMAVHREVVEASYDMDEWEGLIREWIQVGGVTNTCALEVWNRVVNQCGAMEKPKQMSKIDSIRIGKIFHRLGWEKRSIRMPGYGKQRCFVTPEHAETVDNIVSLVGSAEVEVIEEQVRPTESTFQAAFGI